LQWILPFGKCEVASVHPSRWKHFEEIIVRVIADSVDSARYVNSAIIFSQLSLLGIGSASLSPPVSDAIKLRMVSGANGCSAEDMADEHTRVECGRQM